MSYLNNLFEKKVIDQASVTALEGQLSNEPQAVETALIKGGVTKIEILSAKSEYHGVPSRDLDGMKIPFEILKHIPEESAIHYKVVPIELRDGVLDVGMVDPDNIEARDALNFISSKMSIPFKIFVVNYTDFDEVLHTYSGLTGEVSKALTEYGEELTPEEKEIAAASKEVGDVAQVGTETKIVEDAPVTKIVATILRYAAEGHASDVHIEPLDNNVRVRFRVDGELHISLLLPINVQRAVVSRIKILANIKLDERRKPQDGRFTARILGRKIDFRVSTFPTQYGEKIVLRILEQDQGVKTLESLGFSPEHLVTVRRALANPFGILLISGPTGSGKSTTLYSMLNEIDREKRNVVSLEDPIEYNIAGVSQSQVMPEIKYTFANGLRSILRQDPDIIMVGEIRDAETARLAIQAALTGHLVLSTIHTNNAIGVIPRLVDMGIDPYLIAPTLKLCIAQRLVRVLCEGAGESISTEGSIKMMIDKEFETLPEEHRSKINIGNEVYKATPTAMCPNGTRGRIGAFEMLEMSKELEKIILENPVETAIDELARSQGMITMKEDAILKALDKRIPFEEVNTL